MAVSEVHLDDAQLVLIARALGDPKRFDILQHLSEAKETATCSCVREWVGLAPATISHHLRELESAGLIEVTRSGRFAHINLRRDIWTAFLKRLSAI